MGECSKEAISKWLKPFLSSIERETTRSTKDRLILSVERMDNIDESMKVVSGSISRRRRSLEYDAFGRWTQFMFDEEKCTIISKEENFIFPQTQFQKHLLASDPHLKGVWIKRAELNEENGNCQFQIGKK